MEEAGKEKTQMRGYTTWRLSEEYFGEGYKKQKEKLKIYGILEYFPLIIENTGCGI